MSRAVAFITQNEETGEYLVSDEAVAMLSSLPSPIGIVAIAGLWRTGKSYLLNHFSGAHTSGKGGFDVGATVNACTKGLWLWGEPVRLEDGLTVLFVDTEGLGSTSRTQTEDSQIFSLALLLSSTFVWNSRGVIDGNALEDFALVVNLTKHIHVRSNAAAKATSSSKATTTTSSTKNTTPGTTSQQQQTHELDALAEHFPSFVWVVRDFTLRLEDQGRKINDRQYLENALKPQQSFSSEAASRNQIRTLLSSFFKERDCVTLVRPAEDEKTLRNLKNVPLESLRPEFQRGLKQLKAKLYASLRPKAVNGRALTGAMLATLAQTYVEALNAGGVPTIATAWDRVLESQAAEAVDKANAAYDASVNQDVLTCADASRAATLLGDRRAVDVVALELAESSASTTKNNNGSQSKADAEAAEAARRAAPGLPREEADAERAHAKAANKARQVFAKAVWGGTGTDDDASSANNNASQDDASSLLETALRERRKRLRRLNDLASRAHSEAALETVLRELAPPPFKTTWPCSLGGKKLKNTNKTYAETVRDDAQSLLTNRSAEVDSLSSSSRDTAANGQDLPEPLVDETTDDELKTLYFKDLSLARKWLEDATKRRFPAIIKKYAEIAVGPSKWEVFAARGCDAIVISIQEWANEVGVRHRAVTKLARADAARVDEQYQTLNGRLVASESAAQRELDALDRAASDARVAAEAEIRALVAQVEAKRAELDRHKSSTERLAGAFDFATSLLDKQQHVQQELVDDLRRGLRTIRAAFENNGQHDDDEEDLSASDAWPLEDERDEEEDDDDDDDAAAEEESPEAPAKENDNGAAKKPKTKKSLASRLLSGARGKKKTNSSSSTTASRGRPEEDDAETKTNPKQQQQQQQQQQRRKRLPDSWDAADLGFEREELAEFAPLAMDELKERIAEDEKELELMHEHAQLTIEHAKVKKMLLADKDHELQEFEYQWGVAKANVAASEGELMVVDEEVAVLRGTVLQMHRYLEQTSRTGKLPTDVYKALSREQRALLDDLLAA